VKHTSAERCIPSELLLLIARAFSPFKVIHGHRLEGSARQKKIMEAMRASAIKLNKINVCNNLASFCRAIAARTKTFYYRVFIAGL